MRGQDPVSATFHYYGYYTQDQAAAFSFVACTYLENSASRPSSHLPPATRHPIRASPFAIRYSQLASAAAPFLSKRYCEILHSSPGPSKFCSKRVPYDGLTTIKPNFCSNGRKSLSLCRRAKPFSRQNVAIKQSIVFRIVNPCERSNLKF